MSLGTVARHMHPRPDQGWGGKGSVTASGRHAGKRDRQYAMYYPQHWSKSNLLYRGNVIKKGRNPRRMYINVYGGQLGEVFVQENVRDHPLFFQWYECTNRDESVGTVIPISVEPFFQTEFHICHMMSLPC